MSVGREPWGTTRAGEPVELFTLEEGGLRARVASFGATLVSLEVPDRHGEQADVVLGFDTLAEYDSPRNPYFGGVVGRCANRIAGARFRLEGREFQLTANEGKNHLHGGRLGFDRRPWTQVAEERGSISLRLGSPDGDEGYPGRLEARTNYILRSVQSVRRGELAGALGVHFLAHSYAPTVCNLTQHAYFNLAGSGTILDHELQVLASRYVVVDDELVPTGEIASVEDTPFDFRLPRRIGERIGELEAARARGYDLCYVLDGPPLRAPAARLRDPRSGRTLEVLTSQPGLQLYTGNRLDGLPGKRGASYGRFAGLCLETQLFPDAVHHAHFPSVVLRAGEPYYSTTVWLFSAG